jgi:hypothetical protein
MKKRSYRGGQGPDPVQTTGQGTDQFKILMKYLVTIGMCIFIGVMLYYLSSEPEALTSKMYVYTFTVLLILFGVVVYTQNIASIGSALFSSRLVIGLVVAVLVICVLFALYAQASPASLLIVSVFMNFIVVCMVIVALMILGSIAINYVRRTDNTLRFAVEFLFYIPCLLNARVQELWADWKMTPPITAVLLVVEIVLILVYLYLPLLIRWIVEPRGGGVVLHGEPLFLDKGVQSIGTSEVARSYTAPDDLIAKTTVTQPFRRDYAVAMWVSINPGQPTESPIFTYGSNGNGSNGNGSYKPRISYVGSRDAYKFELGPNTVIDHVRVPNQKWIYFVVNYRTSPTKLSGGGDTGSRASIDIFVNGQLAHSESMPSDITYSAADQFTVGGSRPLYGSIGNIIYYPHSLSAAQIANMWNTHSALSFQPPTVLPVRLTE